jgi:DNA-binding MarR family transcriptional regulator
MSSTEHRLDPPHFPVNSRDGASSEAGRAAPSDGFARDVGALLIRGAECLTAAFLECTADAGLNEARYRVLDALERRTGGECSQAELALQLLQSESNLSTLLERMSGDGLISRTRSQTDRRRSLIRMTPPGLEALAQANRSRAATVARLLRFLSPSEGAQLVEGLQRLVGDLESSPELTSRRTYGLDSPFTPSRVKRLSSTGLASPGESHDDRS